MRKAKMKFTLVLALLATVGLADIAQAKKRRPLRGDGFKATREVGPRGRPGPRIPSNRFLKKVIGLSQDQLGQVDTLRSEMEERIKPLKQWGKENRQAVRVELESDLPSPTKVGELVISNHELMQQVRATHESFNSALEVILTSDQLEQWKEFNKNGPRNRRRGRDFRRDGRGPPPPHEG